MAVNRTLLRRYCGALLNAAEDVGEVEDVAKALDRIASAARAEPRFTALLGSPQLDADEKVGLIGAAAGSDCPALVQSFSGVLVTRGRTSLVPEAAAEFRRLAAERSGTIHVEVEAFEPLTAEASEALRKRLSALLETKVTIAIETSTDLVGGMRLRIGDRIVDGSLSGRLEEMRKRMVEGSADEAPNARGDS